MSETDIEPGVEPGVEPGGGAAPDGEAGRVGEAVIDAGAAAVAGAAGAIGLACLSCGRRVGGLYCGNCGQRHDDMRRNVFVLIWDFLRDTFGLDSRMWRTIGALIFKPGAVARSYSHGVRSRYTPPVRLFIGVSFLFFLTLSLTNTYFAAFDLSYEKPEPGERGVVSIARSEKEPPADAAAPAAPETAPGVYLGADESAARPKIDLEKCPTSGDMKFFVRARDITPARADLGECFSLDIDEETSEDERRVAGMLARFVDGAAFAAQNPAAFNAAINDWIPRAMFLMTPLLALILALFFRGKRTLLYDNVIVSLYLHAAGFIIVGASILATQAGAANMGTVAGLGLLIYLVLTFKSAYQRGWVKTVFSAATTYFLYVLLLTMMVLAIVSRVIYDAG